MNKIDSQLTIKHIDKLAYMGWSITICADNTTEHLYYIMAHDGYDTQLNTRGNDISILIHGLYNRIIKFNY